MPWRSVTRGLTHRRRHYRLQPDLRVQHNVLKLKQKERTLWLQEPSSIKNAWLLKECLVGFQKGDKKPVEENGIIDIIYSSQPSF